jgi:OPA family glycerol-3-phosphate transporter-like MFS transporter
MVFWVPSVILTAVAIIWLLFAKNCPEDIGLAPVSVGEESERQLDSGFRTSLAFLIQPGLILLAVVSALQGMVKDGINLWAPTLLMQSQDLAISEATFQSLLIPPFGFLGVIAAGWLNQRTGGDDRRIIGGLYWAASVTVALGAYVIHLQRYSLVVLTVAICSGLIYGVNSLLLTSIPLQFQALGKASTVAGFLDFASYAGAGLMGVLTGSLLDYWSWPRIMLLWGCICALGAIIIAASNFKHMFSVYGEDQMSLHFTSSKKL